MRYAILEGNIVVNIAAASAAVAALNGWIAAEDAAIGDVWNGEVFVTPDPPLPTEQELEKAMTDRMDKVAQDWGFDNRINFAVRTGYTNIWRDKAILFAEWMDDNNAMAYEILEAVKAGLQEPPATTDELIAMLPPVPLELVVTGEPGTIPVTTP